MILLHSAGPGRYNDPMDRTRIFELLHSHAPRLREVYDVESLALFGSVARGDHDDQSDVDILVHFLGRPDFDRFMGLKLELEELLGVRVDLLTPNSIRPDARRAIESEAIRVA